MPIHVLPAGLVWPVWLVVDDGSVGAVSIQVDKFGVSCDFCDIPATDIANIPSSGAVASITKHTRHIGYTFSIPAAKIANIPSSGAVAGFAEHV